MIGFIGNHLLLLSLAMLVGSIIVKGAWRKFLYRIGSLIPAFTFGLLLYAFIISDFSLKTVFFNSSTLSPTIYKIAASWASHEGSMLLWLSMISIVGIASLRMMNLDHMRAAMDYHIPIVAFVQVLFTSFIISTSSPFEGFHTEVTQGLGLNPTLQDIGLSIHPPILYLGFVCYFGTFISGILCLIRPDLAERLLKECRTFSVLGLCFLTAGIGLGSWWAYRELGWGGYWFFDPVENISLLPWLAGIALHHFLLIALKEGEYRRWTVFFAILCFLLTIFGFFFVRSGIISSVHSFAFSPERGNYILAIATTITMLSLSLFVARSKRLTDKLWDDPKFPKFPRKVWREGLMVLGNYLWGVGLVVLLIGIIYPIYYEYAFNGDIAIDPEYYYQVFVPLFIPLLAMAGLALTICYVKKYQPIMLFVLSIFLALPVIFMETPGFVLQAILIVAIYLLLASVVYLLKGIKEMRGALDLRIISIFLGHFGAGLLALSIVLNVIYSAELKFSGVVGDVAENEFMKAKLVEVKFADGDNYYRQIAKFEVIEGSSDENILLKPESRLYKIENSFSSEVDIYTYLSHDLYAVINEAKGAKGDVIRAEIHYKPMMSLIWLSVLFISLSFGLIFIRKV